MSSRRFGRWDGSCVMFVASLIPVLVVMNGCATPLEKRFQSHVDYLASDALGGRGVGSPGIDQAANYIADEFAAIGLEPACDDGTYFQPFSMTLDRELTDDSRLSVAGESGRLHDDFIPFSFSSQDEFSAGVVFCGYGAVAPEHNHDDFAEVDVDGAVTLILRGEPPSWADEQGDMSRHAMFRTKVYNAKDRGAAAVLIVNQRPEEGEDDELMPFDGSTGDEYGIPAFHISRSMAEKLLAQGGADSLDALQDKLDGGEVVSMPLGHVVAAGKAVFHTRRATVKNVVALLRGKGPQADEYVVVGAHYDHLGIRKPMMRRFRGGKRVREEVEPQIHNGADDNASGVAGLIEVARMFAEGKEPNRSILFLAFTAEETGLHGSKYFTNHSPVPLENIVAMLNMDMIGRMKRGARSVQVFGTGCGSGFKDLVDDKGSRVGLKIAHIAESGGNSDHASFVYKKVPSMHFFTGHHADYHKPSDDSDKINAAGGARVTKLVHEVALALATQEWRSQYIVVKTRQKKREGPAPSYKVVMGLAPGYVDDGEPGMAVDRVTPDGPADMAGMKDGDRIVEISGKEVENIYDYMAATSNNKPGDTVEVVVLRNGKRKDLQVTLAAP